MTNEAWPDLEFTGVDNWEPYSGGANDLVSVDGLALMKITKAEPTRSDKGKGNACVKITFHLDDSNHAPTDQGKRGTKTVPYTGTNDKGDNVDMFYDLMYSAGKTREELRAYKGKKLEILKVCKWLESRHFHSKMTTKEWKGSISTDHMATTPEVYNDAKAIGNLVSVRNASKPVTSTKSNGATSSTSGTVATDVEITL